MSLSRKYYCIYIINISLCPFMKSMMLCGTPLNLVSHLRNHIGIPHADLRKLMNGILYVVTTGCTWKGVPRQYGSKSTVNRFHLYLCEHGIYQEIFNELLKKGYNLKKIDLSHCFTDTKDIPAKKGETSVMMATRR